MVFGPTSTKFCLESANFGRVRPESAGPIPERIEPCHWGRPHRDSPSLRRCCCFRRRAAVGVPRFGRRGRHHDVASGRGGHRFGVNYSNRSMVRCKHAFRCSVSWAQSRQDAVCGTGVGCLAEASFGGASVRPLASFGALPCAPSACAASTAGVLFRNFLRGLGLYGGRLGPAAWRGQRGGTTLQGREGPRLATSHCGLPSPSRGARVKL